MRLQQNQVWQQGDQFLRIVVLERLRVEYKAMTDLGSKEGTHHQATKKEFCRLLKGATLVQPAGNAGEGAAGGPSAPEKERPGRLGREERGRRKESLPGC